ncbi:MAG: T9SS type A sorting domain-containing protein, partial [Saprospiraceae bacterium]
TLDTVCWNSCTVCPTAPPATVDITFLVNTANITVDPTGIFLAGGGIFGNPGDNPMTDSNNDGIWEITVTKSQGISGNYIFLNGSTTGWNAKENLQGLPCSDPINYDDRILPLIWNDTTIMTCFETCSADTTCPAPTPTVDLTLTVDMSQYLGTFTTAYVFGSFNSWSGTANPLMDQGNGIWSGTITVPENDSIEYKFLADGVQENFTGGEPCTKTSFGFTNRFLSYGNMNMALDTVCWESCTACPIVPPATVDITVAVDMSQYLGTFTTAYISGSFNSWSGTSNPLTDQGNGIWEGTITVPENDSIEYKFSLDDWSPGESFNGGESCTKTSGGFTNRFLAYGNTNMTLDTVCWNSCMACPASPPATVDITFLVNTANITVDPTGIFLAGGGIFGNPGDNPMVDSNNDGIWEITVTKNQGISGNYIFLNGSTSGWNAKENLQGLPCSDPINYDDRILPLIWSDTTIMTCFATCSADTTCPPPTPTIDLTLSVDMSQYTGSTANGVFINGSFNNWSGSSNPLTDQGNGIWEGTITVPENDSIEYKFTVDGWTDQENFNGGESCTKTTGQNINRFFAYGNMNTTVPTVCWESCTTCPTAADSVDVTFMVDMRLVDTINPTGVFLGAALDNWTGTIAMTDLNNDSIYEVTLSLLGNTSYEFKFINGANWASEEMFDPTTTDSTCTNTTGIYTNRILNVGTVDTSTMAYCYDECSECVLDNTKSVRLTTAFTMMPNPANTYVRLNFDSEFTFMEKRVFLHNSVGQLILNESIDNIQSYDMNTSNIPAGMYYITIQTDEGVQTKRLVINH